MHNRYDLIIEIISGAARAFEVRDKVPGLWTAFIQKGLPMTHDEIIAAQPPIERRFSLACDNLKITRQAFTRSRSEKNRLAYTAALAEYEAALIDVIAERDAQERQERMARVQEYLAKRSKRAKQLSLFT